MNHLIILRDDELFSINIGHQQEKTMLITDTVSAHKPDWDHSAWFDEMLIDDGMIIVLGYNYDLDVSEINRFDLSDSGMITYKDSYLITSDDYYDEVNYATRMINHTYTAYVTAELDVDKPFKEQIPRIARVSDTFTGNTTELDWKPLMELSDIYFPIQSVLDPMLHGFISCPLSEQEFSCQAAGLISSSQKAFYINQEFIYLWTSAWKPEILLHGDFKTEDTYYDHVIEQNDFNKSIPKDIKSLNDSMVYRISLKNFDVDAVKINGVPSSTFSFHQYNNTLYMYNSIDNKEAELIKIPDKLFNKHGNHHAKIIKSLTGTSSLQANHRFIDNYFVIGSERDNASNIYQLNLINILSGHTKTISLSHSINRIEPISDMLLITGKTNELSLGISLMPINDTQNIQSFFLIDRLESEERSHAFNFQQFDEILLMGLSTKFKSKADCNKVSCFWDFQEPSDITYMGFNNHIIDYVGKLNSQHPPYEDCGDACDDWYGNTRPFFIGTRIFALSGEELIEASLTRENQIIEINRIIFTELSNTLK